jgi:multiple sugar transport system ATP-binding protein
VIVGIRPEAFEDAEFAASGLPQIEVTVKVLEELGSDDYVFFEVDAEPIVVEAAAAADESEDTTLLTSRDRALFTARVDPRTAAEVGQTVRLTIDPSRLYFFSPDTGESLLGEMVAATAA